MNLKIPGHGNQSLLVVLLLHSLVVPDGCICSRKLSYVNCIFI